MDSLPEFVDFDLFLSHTSCGRLNLGHDLLSRTQESPTNRVSIPILRHCHVLPDIRYNSQEEIHRFKSILTDCNSFISDFNKQAWGYQNEKNTAVIEHGVDTDFWKPDEAIERDNVCLSVVNDWPNRDWCCGFNLWRKTSNGLPVRVYGKSPGLSVVADSTEHLRTIYQKSKIFYNTSLHSPVPSVLLEAMACGCAIVSTANCMIPEIIQHGENGLLADTADELRASCQYLLDNPSKARELGEAAKKTMQDKFNLQRFVDDWNTLFFNVIDNYRK